MEKHRMKITKEYQDLLGTMKKHAEVLTYLQGQEAAGGSKSLMLSNLQTVAVRAGDGLMVLLRRWEKELAGDNVKPAAVQGPLFPETPEDRAATEADIRAMIETWFSDDVDHDDEGRQAANLAKDQPASEGEGDQKKAAEETFNPTECAAVIKQTAFLNSEAGADEDLLLAAAMPHLERIGDDDQADAAFGGLVMAMLNTGDLTRITEEGEEPVVYTSDAEELRLDIGAMLEAQPEIGTGPVDSESITVVMLPEPDADVDDLPEDVEVVARHIATAEAPVTEAELVEAIEGSDPDLIAAAVEHLVKARQVDSVDVDGHVLYFRRIREVEDLEVLNDDLLALFYVEVIGSKPGQRKRETMASEIVAAVTPETEDEEPEVEDDPGGGEEVTAEPDQGDAEESDGAGSEDTKDGEDEEAELP